jgi:hypothetical protein
VRNKIRFLRVAGNERYSFNLMLALFRRLAYDGDASEEVLDFLRAYQRWLLHMLLAPGARFSSAKIYESIGLIRSGDMAKAKAVFALSAHEAERLIDHLNGEIPDNGIAKLLLAEYVWHEEVTTHDVVEQHLRWPDASLEHVIPQSPDAKSQWVAGFPEAFRQEFTYRLGNMTLLTVKMNAAAKNYEFTRKKEHYAKTLLPMTRELSTLVTITPEYIRERQARIVTGVLRGLGLG